MTGGQCFYYYFPGDLLSLSTKKERKNTHAHWRVIALFSGTVRKKIETFYGCLVDSETVQSGSCADRRPILFIDKYLFLLLIFL